MCGIFTEQNIRTTCEEYTVRARLYFKTQTLCKQRVKMKNKSEKGLPLLTELTTLRITRVTVQSVSDHKELL